MSHNIHYAKYRINPVSDGEVPSNDKCAVYLYILLFESTCEIVQPYTINSCSLPVFCVILFLLSNHTSVLLCR